MPPRDSRGIVYRAHLSDEDGLDVLKITKDRIVTGTELVRGHFERCRRLAPKPAN